MHCRLLLSLKLVPQSCEAGHRCFLRVTSAAKYLSHKLTANSSLISSQVAAIGSKNTSHIITILP